MTWAQFLTITVAAVLAENLILSQVFGVRLFGEVGCRPRRALLSGLVGAVLLCAACVLAWAANLVLTPYGLDSLQPLVFVAILGGISFGVGALLKRLRPVWYPRVRTALPLLAGSEVPLGAALLVTRGGLNAAESAVYGLTAGLGITLALVLYGGISARLELSEHPLAFDGLPITLVTAGLLALAFMGFVGLSVV